MKLFLFVVFSSAVAHAQNTVPAAPLEQVIESFAAEKPAAAAEKGTRPIPKTGVREAKRICKNEGHKGKALAACIGSQTKSQ